MKDGFVVVCDEDSIIFPAGANGRPQKHLPEPKHRCPYYILNEELLRLVEDL